jgi:hypothetical protein
MFLPTLKRSTVIFVAAFFVLVFAPTLASACTCPREASLRAFKRLKREADLIFVGTAKGSVTNGGMNFTVEDIGKGNLQKRLLFSLPKTIRALLGSPTVNGTWSLPLSMTMVTSIPIYVSGQDLYLNDANT